MTDVDSQIDTGVEIVSDLIKAGSAFYPPLAAASPLLMAFVKFEASKWKAGLKAGTIVLDGHGGFVPSTNSRYDPKTGEFL